MTHQARHVCWLQQKFWQCVAGASAMVGGGVVSVVAAFVEETLVRRSVDDEGNNNVGLWNVMRREWCEENGGEWLGEAAPCGDGLVRGRWPSVGAFGMIIRAMWNGNRVSVSMWTRERKEADPWCSFIADWMENWSSRGACGLLVRTGISSTKVISNADHENTSDLIMECYVTDLYCPGNDVTVSHSSATLKHTNSGSERQKTAMPKEALVDAASLEQEFRRSFFLMLIIESRIRPDRLYDPKIYSSTFKEQVHDAQSLRLVEDYSATSIQPDVLQDQQPYLHPGLIDASFQSLMVLLLIGWRSIWTLWHYCVLQSISSFSISLINV